MNVNLNKKSWHSNLYNKLYDDDLPDNLCPYFWKVMVALITLPLWCFLYKIRDSAFEKIIFGSVIEFVALFFGFIFACFYVDVLNTDITWLYYLSPIAGILIPVVILFIFIGIPILCSEIFDKIKNIRYNHYKANNQSDSLFKAKIYAVKNKICPKINWK